MLLDEQRETFIRGQSSGSDTNSGTLRAASATHERTGRSWARSVKNVCEYQSAKALEVCDKEVELGEQAVRLTLQVDQIVTQCEDSELWPLRRQTIEGDMAQARIMVTHGGTLALAKWFPGFTEGETDKVMFKKLTRHERGSMWMQSVPLDDSWPVSALRR